MTPHDAADRLVDAVRDGDTAAFGRLLGEVIECDRAREVAVDLLGRLADALGERLGEGSGPYADVVAIRDLVRAALPACDQVLAVNAVVLEHVARSARGLSGFAAVTEPSFVALYAALLLGRLGLRAEPASTRGRAEPRPRTDVCDAIDVAIRCVTAGDDAGWRRAVEHAVALDAAEADAAATERLRAELVRAREAGDVQPDELTEVVQLSEILAAAVADGPLACPAHLIELAIRRSVAEPGCNRVDDPAQLTFAASEVAGLLQLRLALTPPGWSGHLVRVVS